MPRSPFPPLLAAALAIAAPLSLAGPVVSIDSGKVEGKIDAGIASWKGIPFAAPPVGALRWRAPQAVQPWTGVRQATSHAADCMQLPFPSDAAPLGTKPDEDCLYLNVWKPADVGSKGKDKLPVLVWIYGGGFVNGGSSPPTYSGAELAKQGVVVVSFNYRIGRFGFFAHPQLTQEAGQQIAPGNYGFMDQIAALEWVKRNAAVFGGDPANVTITGESAGGMSVNFLLTSPHSRGLFAKAVVMSGGDGGTAPTPPADAEKIGLNFATGKGIAADDPKALEKLRALPADSVVDGLNLANFRMQGMPTYHGPFADGKLAIDSGAAFAAGRMHKVPVMIGATSADIGGKTGYMVAGARSLAATLADHGVPVWAYRFSYVAESNAKPGAGAGHATDIPFFFDTVAVKYGEQATGKDVAVGKAMSTYMVNFAKRGDPNGAGLPAWPRYARAGDRLMDFSADGKPVAQKDPWGAEIDAASKARADR
ncbi:carboxylesterase family protein [Massilia sp. CFBP9012]|uniref:carboxylesterase/lipase family protein n=1 Tax=Massilia sp. CFBP9012 TaxID=3096531 RepID=UPI002A6AD590|nr:carboxylesterase family protein [Massilia sp. CFBP9012]MDY0976180.1 carboxylesterase family protein [Massilia sp. CFBP9012]